MSKPKLGACLCGSFCTFSSVLPQIEALCADYEVTPIMSRVAFSTDTRFGKAKDFVNKLQSVTGHEVISTIPDAEPIGPKRLFDVLLVAPATGNTLAKLSAGIADTPVTLAVKAHLRNERPVVLAVSTNDALAGAAKNIGALLGMRGYYFVPMRQDDPLHKPRSVVADMSQIADSVQAALSHRQLQPILLAPLA